VRPAFDKSEGLKPAGIDSLGPTGYYPSSAERKEAKLTAGKLYRSREPINGQRIYYIEAKKEYKNPAFAGTEPSCHTISFFKGWILQNENGRLSSIDSRYMLSDCDMKAIASTKLLGILTISGRIFVMTEDHGYEDESYVILELKGSRIKRVLRVYGGGC
jgi:hypothetical protein